MNKATILVVFYTLAVPAALAGDLNPPIGPPASTMKTLDEVEPRTPIHAADLPLLITTPGSYYLAEDIVTAGGGIAVAVSDVTIDLMGFTLEGGTGVGIDFAAQRRCVVRNGTVSGWGSTGISASVLDEGVFEDLRVANCGVNGLLAGSGAQVRRVVSENNGGQGISGEGQISDCIALNNGTNGITFTGLIEDCVAIENGFDGIEFRGSSLVRNCRAEGNGADGFNQPASSTSAGAIVEGCIAEGNVDDGFALHQSSTIHESMAFENGAAGIAVGSDGNTIESNTSLDNAVGLEVTGTDCDVRDNTVRGNADNYDFAPGNRLNLLLCEIPESLDWPCAVTLAGSLTGIAGLDGITIDSSDVTIDLAGHTLSGVPGAGNGIRMVNDLSNITVRNGVIRDWDDNGIDLRITGVSSGEGGHRVIGCTVSNVGDTGIEVSDRSVVQDCVVSATGSHGINVLNDSTVRNCSVDDTGATGVLTSTNSRVEQCVIRNAGSFSIAPGSKSKAIGNIVQGGPTGILLSAKYTEVAENTISGCSGAGILAQFSSGSRIDNNSVSMCTDGIVVEFNTGVVVVRNIVSDMSGVNFNLIAGTITGAITPNPATAGPWDNISY